MRIRPEIAKYYKKGIKRKGYRATVREIIMEYERLLRKGYAIQPVLGTEELRQGVFSTRQSGEKYTQIHVPIAFAPKKFLFHGKMYRILEELQYTEKTLCTFSCEVDEGGTSGVVVGSELCRPGDLVTMGCFHMVGGKFCIDNHLNSFSSVAQLIAEARRIEEAFRIINFESLGIQRGYDDSERFRRLEDFIRAVKENRYEGLERLEIMRKGGEDVREAGFATAEHTA
jgi:hypothetical protein